MDEELYGAIEGLDSGAAICMLGAGFSIGASDGYGKPVPDTTELEKEICDLIGVSKEDGGSLSDLADYCQGDEKFAPMLRELLVQRLTICDASDDQKKLLTVPWRSIFTTNFDDIIERAMPSDKIDVFTPTTQEQQISGEKHLFSICMVVHLIF